MLKTHGAGRQLAEMALYTMLDTLTKWVQMALYRMLQSYLELWG